MITRNLGWLSIAVAGLLLASAGCGPVFTGTTPTPTGVSPQHTATAVPPTATTAPPTLEASPPPTLAPTQAATAESTAGPTDSPTAVPPTAEPTPPPFEPLVGLELVAEGLNAPVDLVPVGDGSGRSLVVDQAGLVRVLTAQGELLGEPFLDVRDRMVGLNPGYDERGLLGLAIPEDYAERGWFYVYYSAPLRDGAPSGWNHTSHLSAFIVSDDENRADPASERILLQVDQPQSNHDGGKIGFGPDGYLYVALGDGGGANDVGNGHVEDWYAENRGGNGQDVTENLLGSLLRIAVDGPGSYAIPPDNPFVEDDGLDEIWAYGFRNPYRFSFDAAGERELFVADVGQNLWEEVSIVTAGGNYGWNVKEGSHCFSPASPNQPPETCPGSGPDGEPLVDPIIEYQNSNVSGGLGRAVVGGYVYRGELLPAFRGRYVFGDWSASFVGARGTLLVAQRPASDGSPWSFEELRIEGRSDGLGEYLLGFGQDDERELYALTSGTPGPLARAGKVYRIVPPGQ